MKSTSHKFPKNSASRTIRKAVLLLTFSFAITANAQWGSKITGNGNIVSKQIKTSDYDKVEVSGFFDVDLVSGKEGNISLSGEENILEHVVVEVVQNTLKIYIQKGLNLRPSKGKKLLITVPFESLDAVSLSGSGDVNTKNAIKTKQFEARLTGSGDVKIDVVADAVTATLTGSGDLVLKGKTQNFECNITGSGDLTAFELSSNNVVAGLSGSGNCKVYCSGNLHARVSGSGDIDYKGDPKKKDTKVSGSGTITKA